MHRFRQPILVGLTAFALLLTACDDDEVRRLPPDDNIVELGDQPI